jgi:hypothetical protein
VSGDERVERALVAGPEPFDERALVLHRATLSGRARVLRDGQAAAAC